MSECEVKVISESDLSKVVAGEGREGRFRYLLDVEPGNDWEVRYKEKTPLTFTGPRIAVPLYECSKSEIQRLKEEYPHAVLAKGVGSHSTDGSETMGFYRKIEVN